MYVNNRLTRKWTPKDDQIFSQMWGVETNDVVCERFGITEAAARFHAYKLGLPQYGKRSVGAEIHGPLGDLEFAPGHVAVDQNSYDLLRKARAIR